jgi:DNA polymerase/3'-5' exonuclease PolX
MSQSEKSYPIDDATQWASKYMTDLRPYFERAAVVGSVRRQKGQVHDIEMLVIPKPGIMVDMFQNPLPGNRLDEMIGWLAYEWNAHLLTNGPQVKKLQLVEGLVLEIYVSTEKRWGVEMVIKTGDADFSHKCVTARRQSGYLPSDCVIKDGWQVYRGDRHIPMLGEGEFLSFLGFPANLSPEIRTGNLVPDVYSEARPA